MIERINLLLKAKNITARQFAEEIGIQPSGMSHILSGRNNPSLDFVMKVMKRWPEVNINWLMFGKGEMFVTPPLKVPAPPEPPAPVLESAEPSGTEFDLFSQPQIPVVEQNREEPLPSHDSEAEQPFEQEPPVRYDQIAHELPKAIAPPAEYDAPQVAPKPTEPAVAQPHENCVNESVPNPAIGEAILAKKRIEKIVVLYTDHTFSEYLPE